MEKDRRSSNGSDGNLVNESECAKKPKAADDLGQIDGIIGDFGKYQLLIFTFKILIGVVSAFNNLGVTFFAPSDFISYSCADQQALTTTHQHNNNSSSQTDTLPYLLESQQVESYIQNRSLTTRIPNDKEFTQLLSDFMSGEERNLKHQQQLDYDTPKNLKKECNFLSPVDNKYHKCTAFQYDTGVWISTIIDEWDLVCDRAWFISMIQSLYMSGFIVSFLTFGYISDRFGRWKSLMIGALIEMGSGFGCALSSSVTTFMIFRFLIGIGNAGRTTSSYLVMIEWSGPKWRMYISTLGTLGWVIGYSVMPWITRYFLHFRHMQLFACFYELVFIIWLIFIPESPRWLLTHKKFDKAREVLLMAAKFNGLLKKDTLISDDKVTNACGAIEAAGKKHPFDEVAPRMSLSGLVDVESNDSVSTQIELKPYTMSEFETKFENLIKTTSVKEFTKNENKLSILDLFRWKNLRRYTLILAFAWAANSFIYYGIALRVGDFGGRNLFVSFTIAGLTELPSIAFTIVCMKFLPRKTTNLFMFAMVGLLCAVQPPLKYYDYQWLQQSSIMLAKFFNSCSFTCILYQTMELFPTSIRQTAYSSCSLAGRIGSILAPFIKELSQITNSAVPPVIYAALSILSAILAKDLPETQGSDLPDTLLEAEKFKGTDKLAKCAKKIPTETDSILVKQNHSRTLNDTKNADKLID